ncbi:MAG: hypothetical protein ACR2JW_06865 [Thermomicrobiales bacterium]
MADAAMPDADENVAQPALAVVLSQLRRLYAPLTEIGTVRPAAADAADRIERVLRRLPPGAMIGAAIDELRGQLESALAEQRRVNIEAFGLHEAAFIRAAREAGIALREQNAGWRVGPIEFVFRRGAAQACAMYNHEEIVRWTAVADVSDLDKIVQRGQALLDRARASLPDDLLIAVIWDAYVTARAARAAARAHSPDTVPVLDFYRDLRFALVRHDLAGKRPETKLAHAEMPKWAFLYHLDRYRALSAEMPTERRLGFQTGSQAESTRGRCVTLNGLDAAQEYKEFCHLLPPRVVAT